MGKNIELLLQIQRRSTTGKLLKVMFFPVFFGNACQGSSKLIHSMNYTASLGNGDSKDVFGPSTYMIRNNIFIIRIEYQCQEK